eukprot:COSAG06_NODE_281_length_18447_cov_14.060116_2_plen_86_part_00
MMVLEWYDCDLKTVVLDRKQYAEFPTKTALDLAMGVASGMAYIHRNEILHLDLKLVRDLSLISIPFKNGSDAHRVALPHCSCRRM